MSRERPPKQERGEHLTVPGLRALADKLRAAYPNLPEQALRRILRLPEEHSDDECDPLRPDPTA
jgi:hypothetical protein